MWEAGRKRSLEERRDEEEKGGRGLSPAEISGARGKRVALPRWCGAQGILAPRVRAGLLHTCRGF